MIPTLAFALGFLAASLLEYWVHRAMHWGWLLGRRHAEHHRDGWGQGFWPELRDYLFPGGLLVVALPLLWRWDFGAGWAGGALTFAGFSAYAHQLQHDNAARCRWMPMPVHYVHHTQRMWHHNFGMAVDWWDRVFGTYRRVEIEEDFDEAMRARSALDIHWLPHSPETARRAGRAEGA